MIPSFVSLDKRTSSLQIINMYKIFLMYLHAFRSRLPVVDCFDFLVFFFVFLYILNRRLSGSGLRNYTFERSLQTSNI